MKSLAALLLALSSLACTSVVQVPPVSPEVLDRIEAVPSPQFRAHVHCGETVLPIQYEAAMDLLSRSPWFESLDATQARATIHLSIDSAQQTPYWHRPGHSLAMSIVSLIVPIAYEEKSGFLIRATLPDSGARTEFDTRREWTSFAWGLATLMNVFPGRSFSVSKKRELDHLHAGLLPLVERLR